MATVVKFTTPVSTSMEGSEYVSWINRLDIPVEVLRLLTQIDPKVGAAWNIRMDRWINPDGKIVDVKDHLLAYNDATMPRLVNGHVDYSAWDD